MICLLVWTVYKVWNSFRVKTSTYEFSISSLYLKILLLLSVKALRQHISQLKTLLCTPLWLHSAILWKVSAFICKFVPRYIPFIKFYSLLTHYFFVLGNKLVQSISGQWVKLVNNFFSQVFDLSVRKDNCLKVLALFFNSRDVLSAELSINNARSWAY